MRQLTSVAKVVDKLGGPAAVGRLMGVTTQAVWNWKATKKLPGSSFLILRQALAEQGYTAPPALWGILEPEQRIA